MPPITHFDVLSHRGEVGMPYRQVIAAKHEIESQFAVGFSCQILAARPNLDLSVWNTRSALIVNDEHYVCRCVVLALLCRKAVPEGNQQPRPKEAQNEVAPISI